MKGRAIHRQKTIGRRLLKGIVFVFVLTGAGLALYSWHLSAQIEKRFSGRRWSIPSTVFSDTTLLYPGQGINKAFLYEKLRRLGYRKVSHMPERKGEVRISGPFLEVFFHDLEVPWRKQEGFPARIRFASDCIESIVRLDTGEPAPILELEPEEIGRFFGPGREQRRLVSLDQVPEHLIHAVLAAEDNQFYRHRGVDIQSVLRALYVNMRHGTIRQGGSTLTQQLAKNYFLTPDRTLSRKLKELLMALLIEAMYKKDEILEIYLNEIYLGQKGSVSINGVGEASYFFFDKPVKELSLTEAAVIAGLIRAPNYYSPYVDRKRCRTRRNTVLLAMHKHGWLSQEKLKISLSAPVNTAGFNVYSRKAPYFMDYISEQLTTLYPPEALSSLGLSIYTTLDTEVQRAAERALARGLSRLEKSNSALNRLEPEKKLQGAVIVKQPKTGYILAMVGGRDYGLSQFNRITQARRQPGSAFKPFVYLSGLDEFTPASLLSNKPTSYTVNGKLWEPQNFEPVPEHRLRLRDALARSINVATVDLAMQVGLNRIVSTANAFGFSTPLKPYPSLALGAFEAIPLELARAYCAFAADGVLPYPLSVKAVMDEKGRVLEQRHMTIKRVISPARAFIITSMLQSVITGGTARSLKQMGISFPVAGKTGTTNDYKDAWFVGYTPDILALVWVGFDDGDSIHAPGSSAALPIWADLINSIPRYISGETFHMPPGVVQLNICPESGLLAVPHACPEPLEEVFLEENVPTEDCSIHRSLHPFERIIKGVRDALH